MVCPKCGTKNNSYYCVRCGYVNKEDNDYQIFNETYPIEDIELFIGNHQEYIINKPTNYAAALTGGLYYLYRKMYILGTILIVADLYFLYILLILNNLSWILLLTLLKMYLYAMFTNPIYLFLVRRKVNKIKMLFDYDQKYLSYNGGTNINAPIIALIAMIISTTTFILIMITR